MAQLIYIPNNNLMDKSLELRDDYNKFVREVKKNQQSPSDFRIILSAKYLRGRGLEVGAFHAPIYLLEDCQADYVDKVDIETLKKWMPETNELYCVYPSIIDNGEELTKIEPQSYDFLVANHMLEHTENVFRTIENHIRVIKEGGYLFYALPDKRQTFDIDRKLTTYEHLKNEYYHGSDDNRIEHYREFGKLVSKIADEDALDEYVDMHIKENRDIHFHVWQYDTFLSQIQQWIKESNLNIEILEHAPNGIEFIIVFKVLTKIEIAERFIRDVELEKAKKILFSLAKKEEKDLEVQNDIAVIAIMEERFADAKSILQFILDIDESNEVALENYQYLIENLKNNNND